MPGLRVTTVEEVGSMWRNKIVAFHLAKAERKQLFEGEGRGLRKARRAIEEAGGTMTIASDPFKGVTVTVGAAPSPRSISSMSA